MKTSVRMTYDMQFEIGEKEDVSVSFEIAPAAENKSFLWLEIFAPAQVVSGSQEMIITKEKQIDELISFLQTAKTICTFEE